MSIKRSKVFDFNQKLVEINWKIQNQSKSKKLVDLELFRLKRFDFWPFLNQFQTSWLKSDLFNQFLHDNSD